MKNQIIISEPTFEKARKSIRESQKKDSESHSNCSQLKGQWEWGKKNSVQEIGGNCEQFAKQKLQVIFSSSDDDLIRKVLEKEKIDGILINLENRNDFQKQRNSGFNQVIAKLVKKQNAFVGINLDELVSTKSLEKQKILARIKQNIKLCNKNKVQMKFIAQNPKNERNIYDLKALGLVLGMPTNMIKFL